MLKSVRGVRWTAVAKAKSNERKKTEHVRVVRVSYLAEDLLLPIYIIIQDN